MQTTKQQQQQKQLQNEEVHLLEQLNVSRGGEKEKTRMTGFKRPGELAQAVPLFGCKNALAAPGKSVLGEVMCNNIGEAMAV